MKYYEIKNKKTNETAQQIATTFAKACDQAGWRVKDCRCVWTASAENAGDAENY